MAEAVAAIIPAMGPAKGSPLPRASLHSWQTYSSRLVPHPSNRHSFAAVNICGGIAAFSVSGQWQVHNLPGYLPAALMPVMTSASCIVACVVPQVAWKRVSLLGQVIGDVESFSLVVGPSGEVTHCASGGLRNVKNYPHFNQACK